MRVIRRSGTPQSIGIAPGAWYAATTRGGVDTGVATGPSSSNGAIRRIALIRRAAASRAFPRFESRSMIALHCGQYNARPPAMTCSRTGQRHRGGRKPPVVRGFIDALPRVDHRDFDAFQGIIGTRPLPIGINGILGVPSYGGKTPENPNDRPSSGHWDESREKPEKSQCPIDVPRSTCYQLKTLNGPLRTLANTHRELAGSDSAFLLEAIEHMSGPVCVPVQEPPQHAARISDGPAVS